MKKLFLLIITLGFSVTIAIAQSNPKNNEVYEQVDQTPEYPGGMPALVDFIGKNLKYPSEAHKNKIEGKVLVKLLIEEDGTISETEIMKGLGHGCDQEVTRVIKLMPKWKPGKKDNAFVRTSLVLPVMFALERKSSK
ncbi:energy transducer TonB [Emticicia sp. 17c]|uniref:energy transducer TonB n=1 Tax=Emticicia sp. 17c TaxID=3127704 RepID=UPI00301E2AD3